MPHDAVKVSVLASGAILLEGNAASLVEIEAAFRAAKERNSGVLYYREAAASEPPPQAQSVLQLIVANRLPVSLCTKPDFSDWVDRQGLPHPREAAPATSDLAFAKARQFASSKHAVAIVRPDRETLLSPAPPPGSMAASATKAVEAMIPSAQQRNVAVIADTSFAAAAKPPEITEIARAIPFFGYLIGFSYIGHAVWIFEADASVLAAGCRDADVLLVDSAVGPRLPKEWVSLAGEAMRNANILVLDRATQKFLVARTASNTPGKIEFPNDAVRVI